MTDVQKMQGTFKSPETDGEVAILKGTAAGFTDAGLSERSDRIHTWNRQTFL